MLISITVEGETYARPFIDAYADKPWDGTSTPLDIAMIVAACHTVELSDVKFVGGNGESYNFYVDGSTAEVLEMLYVTIPYGLNHINHRLDAMRLDLDDE